jgi:hypothetical protein
MESFPLLELLAGTIRDSIAALVKPFTIVAHSLQVLSYSAAAAVFVWLLQVLKR